ncbi:hypothetical protein RHMOL_Rhmol11G0043000 [Rhododendron molle]|uniref:Uncharacterized protein n=1 Tax=Rhododendron molle TaxID=49168 RepID=A0ACC0LQ55_RHOML|nr:hypothetical protein RHMOL_Rhmol11G0043000 [Rhododendron molle]
MYDSDLHLTGFLVYWLSFFVIPDFPYEGPNHTVFLLAVSLARGDFVPLGPLFLGYLFHHLDQVHVDTERSMGRYVMVSVVHTQFLMAFCFEHFPSLVPSLADISEGEEPRPRIMRWSGGAPTQAVGTPRSEETPLSVCVCWYEGGEHTPLIKLKRKREDDEACEQEGCSNSSIDDNILISQSFKLPCTAELSSSGKPVVEGKRLIDLAEGESNGTDSDAEGSDDRNTEEGEGSGADGSEEDESDENGDGEDQSGDDNNVDNLGGNEDENGAGGDANGNDADKVRDGDGEGGGGDGNMGLGIDTMAPIVEEDEEEEEDEDAPGLITRRRILMEGLLSVPDINQLAPEAVIQQSTLRAAVETALDLFDGRVSVPPIGDLATHFQAHDAAMAFANLTSAEVFAALQDVSLISLGTLQAGYAVGDVGEGSSLLVGGSILQQQVETSTSRGHVAADDDSEVQVVEPPVVNEVEALSNEAFFGYYDFPREVTSFLSFVRDHFPYTFFKVRNLCSQTMGRLQFECLYSFLQSIKDIRVCDLGLDHIEEIDLMVQNFDKLEFDFWWVYKKLDAAKIMRENDVRWKYCEGAKAALEEAHVALARARDTVAAAEAVVEERKLAYECMVEEIRLGDRLIDVPLCDTNPFLKKIFG